MSTFCVEPQKDRNKYTEIADVILQQSKKKVSFYTGASEHIGPKHFLPDMLGGG